MIQLFYSKALSSKSSKNDKRASVSLELPIWAQHRSDRRFSVQNPQRSGISSVPPSSYSGAGSGGNTLPLTSRRRGDLRHSALTISLKVGTAELLKQRSPNRVSRRFESSDVSGFWSRRLTSEKRIVNNPPKPNPSTREEKKELEQLQSEADTVLVVVPKSPLPSPSESESEDASRTPEKKAHWTSSSASSPLPPPPAAPPSDTDLVVLIPTQTQIQLVQKQTAPTSSSRPLPRPLPLPPTQAQQRLRPTLSRSKLLPELQKQKSKQDEVTLPVVAPLRIMRRNNRGSLTAEITTTLTTTTATEASPSGRAHGMQPYTRTTIVTYEAKPPSTPSTPLSILTPDSVIINGDGESDHGLNGIHNHNASSPALLSHAAPIASSSSHYAAHHHQTAAFETAAFLLRQDSTASAKPFTNFPLASSSTAFPSSSSSYASLRPNINCDTTISSDVLSETHTHASNSAPSSPVTTPRTFFPAPGPVGPRRRADSEVIFTFSPVGRAQREKSLKRKTGLDGVFVVTGVTDERSQWEQKDLPDVLDQLRKL